MHQDGATGPHIDYQTLNILTTYHEPIIKMPLAYCSIRICHEGLLRERKRPARYSLATMQHANHQSEKQNRFLRRIFARGMTASNANLSCPS